jgi:hypothetical protein
LHAARIASAATAIVCTYLNNLHSVCDTKLTNHDGGSAQVNAHQGGAWVKETVLRCTRGRHSTSKASQGSEDDGQIDA